MNVRKTGPNIPLMIGFFIALIGVGCAAPRHGQLADIIIPDAHGGGSYITISSDSSLVASGGWSGWMKLWQLPDGTKRNGWRAHGSEVTGIVFIQDNEQILSGGFDGSIRIWTPDGKLLNERQTGSPITHLVANEQQKLILTGHKDGSVKSWQMDGLGPIKQWTHHVDWVRSVAISPIPGRFASSGADGRVWSWGYERAAQEQKSPETDIRTLVFTPDGNALIGGGWFNLYRWGLNSGDMTLLKTEHGGIINDIRFHPDRRSLVSISRNTDSAVLRLDALSGKTLEYYQPHKLCGSSVSISKDGQYLASTSDDASVMIWKLRPLQ